MEQNALQDQNPTIGSKVPDVNEVKVTNVKSAPEAHTVSSTFLQNLTHTGYQVRMKLPFGAENGPVPVFAYRVDPVTLIPDIRTNEKYNTALSEPTTNVRVTNMASRLMNIRPFNGAELMLTGCESPQSIMAKCFRYNRVDMVYSLRFMSNYTGSGLFMVVPVKAVNKNMVPFSGITTGGPFASAWMNNSHIVADISKTREIKFTYPYEYTTEYRDLFNTANATTYTDPENWFVVLARGNFETSGQTYIDIFIDHAFGEYSLMMPLVPRRWMTEPALPCCSYVYPDSKDSSKAVNGSLTQVYAEDYFPDVVRASLFPPAPPKDGNEDVLKRIDDLIKTLEI